MNNPGNDVTAVAGVIAGALRYTDANALTIGTPGLGLATANAPVTIATIDGDLTISDRIPGADVSAGASTLRLTAGSALGQSRALILNAGAGVTATGGVLLIADRMGFSATVDAGAGVATVQPFTIPQGVTINLRGDVAQGALAW